MLGSGGGSKSEGWRTSLFIFSGVCISRLEGLVMVGIVVELSAGFCRSLPNLDLDFLVIFVAVVIVVGDMGEAGVVEEMENAGDAGYAG